MIEAWRHFRPVEQLMADASTVHNPVVITVCLSLSRNVSRTWLRANLIQRMLCHPRFASSLVPDASGRQHFELVHGFTLTSSALNEHHLTVCPVADSGCRHAERERLFSQQLADIMSTPLDMRRPLWKVFLFPQWSIVQDGTETADRCMVVVRVHHAIADGIGLLKFFSSEVIDQGHEKHLRRFLVIPERQREKLGVVKGNSSGRTSRSSVVPDPKKPVITASAKPGMLQKMWEAVEDLYLSSVRMLIPDPDSVFTRSEIQREKVCALLPPSHFTINMLKDACSILGVTINDFLYTAISGASRGYLQEHGDNPNELKNLRCAIPFNRHMMNDFQASDMSNQFALVVLDLHVDESERIERLKKSVGTLQRVKRSFQLSLLLGLLDLVSQFPRYLRVVLWRHLTKASSILFTNMPGPKQSVKVGGVDVSCLHFFAPSDGHAGVVISVFSYAGRLAMGVSGDKERISDPQRFVELLRAEIESLIQVSKDA